MSELKNCPFCGGEAELCYSEVDTFCRKCNVMQETELWNTRPIEDDLRKRIAELEAENKKAFDLVRKLRMYCIYAEWDNPDTEDEFNEFDAEVCEWLSKFMERAQ